MLRHNDIEQTRPARHGWCAVLAAATVCLAFGAAAATAQGQPNDREPWRSNETEQDERQPQAERGERGDRPAFDRSRRGRGPGGLGRMFQNRRPFDSREVFHMGEALEMDESQIVLVRAMYDGFSDAVDAEREATREKMRSMRDDLRDQMRNGEGMTDMVTRMTDMQRQSEQRIRDLEASFLEGVRTTVLTEEQQDDWERYVRDQRRRSSLSAGARLPGEGIDLVEIVDDLDLTEEEQAEIAPDLENYVNELDQALIAEISSSIQWPAASSNCSPAMPRQRKRRLIQAHRRARRSAKSTRVIWKPSRRNSRRITVRRCAVNSTRRRIREFTATTRSTAISRWCGRSSR